MTSAANSPGGAPITVVLVDDHVLVREGLSEILAVETDIAVVGEAADSASAVARVASLRPDVVLLDVEIPGNEATDTVQRMRSLSPNTRVLVLTMFDGPQLLRRLLAAGISGYLLKSVDRKELVAAIRSVHVAPDRIVLSVSRDSLAQAPAYEGPVLSEREAQIMQLVAQALSNGQVGTRLGISEATVKRHLRNIFVKLGAVSRIDAVNKANAASLIVPVQDSAASQSAASFRPGGARTSAGNGSGASARPGHPALNRRHGSPNGVR
jgi:DNA-binding NarL/FixJ family response regulator